MTTRQASMPQLRFQVGDRVNVNMQAYLAWYAEHVPNGCSFPELGGDNMTVEDAYINTGDVHVNGNGWGAYIPPHFLERSR